MTGVQHAFNEALHKLDRLDYNTDRAILYANPETVDELKEGLSGVGGKTGDSRVGFHGSTVEKTDGVPNGVVVAAHIDAARLGPGAIAFARVDGEDQ